MAIFSVVFEGASVNHVIVNRVPLAECAVDEVQQGGDEGCDVCIFGEGYGLFEAAVHQSAHPLGVVVWIGSGQRA